MPILKKNDCELFYEICGKGSPLVLLHGLAADSASWLPVKNLLAQDFKLLLLDNRLSGRSSSRGGQPSSLDLARDVKAAMDDAGIKKAAIIGHSMGGYVAQEFALAYPDCVSALVLEDTGPASSARNVALMTSWADLLDAHGYSSAFWSNMFPWLLSSTLYAQRPDFAAAAVSAANDYKLLPSPENFRRQVGILKTHDTRSRLADIKAPALVISGEEDVLVAPAKSRAMSQALPDSRFALMPETGHLPHLERPGDFVKLVKDFLCQTSTPNA